MGLVVFLNACPLVMARRLAGVTIMENTLIFIDILQTLAILVIWFAMVSRK
jgi:hypothetical protein